jgi:5-methylcytosine-specific restriction endonuclease McrA
MKNKILELHAKGLNYSEIAKELGCSKGTISYHCGKGQKAKALERQKKNRKTADSKIRAKLQAFMRNKVRNFKRGRPELITNAKFDYAKAFKKINEYPCCYLSGSKIDLEDSSSYELDHITPLALGGKNTLSNMGLALKEVNRSKADMTKEDYLELCIKVLKHNGYEVNIAM